MTLKCLVVDDVAVSRYVDRAALESLGFVVVEAEDADACLAELGQNAFDAIVLDWHLRRESSLPLIAKIRAVGGHAATPIIICSGVEDAGAAGQAEAAGANGYLLKPASVEKFREQLTRLRVIS